MKGHLNAVTKTMLPMGRTLTIGGVLSGVSAALLAIYQNEVRDSLDSLLSHLLGIPKGMVGYYVVAIVFLLLLCFCVVVSSYWVCKRIGARKESPEKTLETNETRASVTKIASVMFEAGIFNKKSSYHMGESIQLWAKCTGKLDRAYHVIHVSSLSGATVPKGREWWSDPDTYHNPDGSGRVGKLIVPPVYEYRANEPLSGFPVGEYRIVFEIGEGRLSEGRRLARAQDTFVVESTALSK